VWQSRMWFGYVSLGVYLDVGGDDGVTGSRVWVFWDMGGTDG
jgi:hypothetical protein